MIKVEGLTKTFRVHQRPGGFWPAVRSLMKRRWDHVQALRGIDFSIAPGERVGFLGPNGAGKTTTLKVLSGLIHPSSGTVSVGGFEPRQRAAAFLRSITLVMGQKQQLLWDLPPVDTYAMNRALFDLPRAAAKATVDELVELLDIADVIHKPTRQLSLGERMKCELVAALLHRPKVLFLDEPTIGLDVTMQARMRQFVREYNARYEATVLLTTHYMEDVAALCPRVIVIDRGQLVHDGPLGQLVQRIRPEKRITIRLAAGRIPDEVSRMGKVVHRTDSSAVLAVARDQRNQVLRALLLLAPAADLSIEEPPVDEVMRELFHPAGQGEEQPPDQRTPHQPLGVAV